MMGMLADKESTSKGIMSWAPEDIKAHIAFMINLNKELKASGELVSAEGLAWPDQAKLVRAKDDGTPDTDGVFAESKEFLILLDHRCREPRASLRDCREGFRSTRQRGRANEDTHRGPPDPERSAGCRIIETQRTTCCANSRRRCCLG